jgi:hypothetical protein
MIHAASSWKSAAVGSTDPADAWLAATVAGLLVLCAAAAVFIHLRHKAGEGLRPAICCSCGVVPGGYSQDVPAFTLKGILGRSSGARSFKPFLRAGGRACQANGTLPGDATESHAGDSPKSLHTCMHIT